ncbi:hypothetical protein AMTR_s00061p00192880, partial [Amborella trichopoda]
AMFIRDNNTENLSHSYFDGFASLMWFIKSCIEDFSRYSALLTLIFHFLKASLFTASLGDAAHAGKMPVDVIVVAELVDYNHRSSVVCYVGCVFFDPDALTSQASTQDHDPSLCLLSILTL